MRGWIGVDLDGTLAVYNGWNNGAIGEPIPAMVERVKAWLADGQEVRIFTARVAASGLVNEQGVADDIGYTGIQRQLISDWCELHVGARLKVTATKDMGMIELWDDRAVAVECNTGKLRAASPSVACSLDPTADTGLGCLFSKMPDNPLAVPDAGGPKCELCNSGYPVKQDAGGTRWHRMGLDDWAKCDAVPDAGGAQGWRLLEVGERLNNGDEYYSVHSWKPVTNDIGDANGGVWPIRRRMLPQRAAPLQGAVRAVVYAAKRLVGECRDDYNVKHGAYLIEPILFQDLIKAVDALPPDAKKGSSE